MTYTSSKSKRSPIKEKPLHNPGDSLEQELDHVFEEQAIPLIFFGVFALILVGLEWWRWFSKIPPNPVATTIGGVIAIGYAVFKLAKLRPAIRSLRLGLEGERYVGQSLEQLRGMGCHVFHDIPADGFNVDHVVLSTQGLFVIETKTISKPARAGATITLEGDRLPVDGREPDRNPVAQAIAIGHRIGRVVHCGDHTPYHWPRKVGPRKGSDE